ncbi:hypothetical protein L1049_010401 [Liquidambar formosana]|uniref:Uncharacterized protein n=1 Tax=Liquidambar formosana TaxID=63359 RepID=A0AAP0NBF0_LIQFO
MEQQLLELEAYQKQSTAAREKEIRELRSRISRLESKPPSKASATTKGLGSDAAFGKELDELKHRVAKLERIPPIDALMKKQESAIEQLKQANSALQKKIVELTSTVDELRSTSFTMTHTRDSAGAVIPESSNG